MSSIEAASDVIARDPSAQWVEMCTGRAFYVNAPVYDIAEIAHSLSKMCRFGGHCKRFYSVAEHSVLVADIMEVFGLGNPMEGLLHDGTESVLSDMPSPVKALLPDYKRLEARLDRELRKQFELPLEMSPGCKHADWVAVVYEAEQLLPSQARSWPYVTDAMREDVRRFKARFGNIMIGEHPDYAERMFLRRYERLGGQRG